MPENNNEPKPRIMIGKYDVTEHVACMYDALINSLDWGSNFLSIDDQHAILTVGRLAGFKWNDPSTLRSDAWRLAYSQYPFPVTQAVAKAEYEIEQMRAQVQAAIDAKVDELFNAETCESVATELLTNVERLGK